MYESHFGLSEKPFSLSPDPRFIYMSRRHGQAYAMLQYGVQEQLGFAVITGEVGAGKTTLLRQLLTEFTEKENVALVSNTHRNLESIIPTILDAFAVGTDQIPQEPEFQYRLFVDFLVAQYAKGRRSILIIDEAQNLTVDALEQLRLLSNVNADGHLLLQTILVGQPELRQNLSKPELRQFAQRISVDFFLPALGRKEVLDYIDHRVAVAGGAEKLFSHEAKILIALASDCVPRVVNSLCDLALVYAYGEGKHKIDKSLVVSVIKDKQSSGILPVISMKELKAKIDEIKSSNRPALSAVPSSKSSSK